MYPLKMKPVFKEVTWGGRKLKTKFNKDIPEGNIGESWEVASHKNGSSIVDNGYLKGKTLDEALNDFGLLKGEKFPLLLKIIDASDKLSIQVHPSDDYALKYENGELGKTEMWYVIDADYDSKIIYGFSRDITAEEFCFRINNSTLEEVLNFVPAKRGDCFFVPAGTLHAIGGGLLIAEIQQNSDTTYRVYDFNRKDKYGNLRELSIDRAIDVTCLENLWGREIYKPEIIFEGKNKVEILCDCQYFRSEKITVKKEINQTANSFDILLFLEGEGKIEYENGVETFKAGDSFVVPTREYKVTGNCEFMRNMPK